MVCSVVQGDGALAQVGFLHWPIRLNAPVFEWLKNSEGRRIGVFIFVLLLEDIGFQAYLEHLELLRLECIFVFEFVILSLEEPYEFLLLIDEDPEGSEFGLPGG